MRIITATLIAIMATASAAFATTMYINNNDRPVEFNELPAKAKSFIQENFANEEVSHIILDKDIVCSDYTVLFLSGTKLEFDGSGDWTEIDCGRASVPEALVAQQIAEYVKAKHPNNTITELKREHGNTEVKLNGGLELTFNSRYRIVDVDD
jgi:hypothetical protein